MSETRISQSFPNFCILAHLSTSDSLRASLRWQSELHLNICFKRLQQRSDWTTNYPIFNSHCFWISAFEESKFPNLLLLESPYLSFHSFVRCVTRLEYQRKNDRPGDDGTLRSVVLLVILLGVTSSAVIASHQVIEHLYTDSNPQHLYTLA